jgi:nucleotide-binding universal stress UspA family protein
MSSLSMYTRILAPIDGSPIASHALDEALKIARESGAELQPLFVIDLPPVSGGDASAAFYVNTRDAFVKESAALDADASVRMHQAGVRGAPRVVEVELTRDDIAHRILKSAQEFGADPRGDRNARAAARAWQRRRALPAHLMLPGSASPRPKRRTAGRSSERKARHTNASLSDDVANDAIAPFAELSTVSLTVVKGGKVTAPVGSARLGFMRRASADMIRRTPRDPLPSQ